jgi:hypothetical protein
MSVRRGSKQCQEKTCYTCAKLLPWPWGDDYKSHIGLGAKGQEWTRPWQSRCGSADRTVEMKHMTICRILLSAVRGFSSDVILPEAERVSKPNLLVFFSPHNSVALMISWQINSDCRMTRTSWGPGWPSL